MTINIKRKINAPSDALWTYLADYENIHRFHPLIKSEGSHYLEDSNSCELGSLRQCNFTDGNWIKEKLIELKEGSHYTVDIYESNMPMKEAKATLGVKSLGENQSEAFMKMEITPKYKIMQPMMYLMFRYRNGPMILKGLEDIYKKEHQLKLA